MAIPLDRSTCIHGTAEVSASLIAWKMICLAALAWMFHFFSSRAPFVEFQENREPIGASDLMSEMFVSTTWRFLLGSVVPMPTLPVLSMRMRSVGVMALVAVVVKTRDVGAEDAVKVASANALISAPVQIWEVLPAPRNQS